MKSDLSELFYNTLACVMLLFLFALLGYSCIYSPVYYIINKDKISLNKYESDLLKMDQCMTNAILYKTQMMYIEDRSILELRKSKFYKESDELKHDFNVKRLQEETSEILNYCLMEKKKISKSKKQLEDKMKAPE